MSGSITANPYLKSSVSPPKQYSFPGPSGSIFDYKTAPIGGGGPDKAWLVTPVNTNNAYTDVHAFSGAASHADSVGLTQKLLSSLPGAPGSIFDSKPVSDRVSFKPSSTIPVQTVNSGAPCTGVSCLPSGGYGYRPTDSFPGAPGSIYDSTSNGQFKTPGCSGSFCSSSGTYKPSNPHPEVSGSIYDSKPFANSEVGCTGGGCSPSIINKPLHNSASGCFSDPLCIALNTMVGVLPGPPDRKPSTGCSTLGCSGQHAGNAYTLNTQGSTPSSYPTFQGTSSSIHNNKPVTGISSSSISESNAQLSAGVTQGIYQSGSAGSLHPLFPGSSGSIYDSKPVRNPSSCSDKGCSAQQVNDVYISETAAIGHANVGTGISTTVGSNMPAIGTKPEAYYPGSSAPVQSLFPGNSGSIYDSKPVSNIASSSINNAATGESVAAATQTTHQPTLSIPLPGSSNSIHQSKPVIPAGATNANLITTGISQSATINPALPHIIENLPGQPGSIYNSKPTRKGISHGSTYVGSNAGAGTSVQCAGSSCTYFDTPINKSPDTSGCSGSLCNSRPSSPPGYIAVPVIPVGIVTDGLYHKKPTTPRSGCVGSSCSINPIASGCSSSLCGTFNGVKPVLETMLLPPATDLSPYTSKCTGTACSLGGSPISTQPLYNTGSGCSGSSCFGSVTSSGSNTVLKNYAAAGSDAGKCVFSH